MPASQRSPSPEECSGASSPQTAWHMPPSPWPWSDPSLQLSGVCHTTCNAEININTNILEVGID